MAREFARMRVSSFDDPDLEELGADAQWLYFRVLIPHPALSAAGVMPWKPKHWVRKARGMTLARIRSAAAELERHRNILVDLDTDELLVRSYVRNDEPLRNPRMASAVVKAYQTVASRALQGAIVTEVARIRAEHPEFSSWDHKDTKAGLALLLSRPNLSAVGYGYALTEYIAEPNRTDNTDTDPVQNTNGQAVHNGIPDPVQNTYPDPVENSVPHPDTEQVHEIGPEPTNNINYNTQPATSGGYVTGERHQREPVASQIDPPPKFHPGHEGEYDPDCDRCTQTAAAREAWLINRAVVEKPEPALGCDRHPANDANTACRACQAARKTHEQWRAERADRRRVAADHKRDEIRHCDLCDEAGWRIPPPQLADADPPVVRCTHEPAMPGAWRELIAELLAEVTEPERTKTDV